MFGMGTLPMRVAQGIIVLGDFNGDGLLDLFIAAAGYDGPPFGGEVNVLLVSNPDGTYSDRSATLPQAPDFTASATAGDINGDGYLDLYVGNVGGSPIGPYFLIGRGDGTFTQKITGLPPTMSAGLFDNTNIPGGNFELFNASEFVDVDQDGHLDLVLGIKPNAHVDNIVLFNDGTGDYTRRPRLVLPRGPLPIDNFGTSGIVPLDINRDGLPDLILMYSAHLAAGFALQALVNRGDGTFADETIARFGTSNTRTTGTECGVLSAADLNGDGWLDLYCTTGPMDIAPRYLMNSGTGTWTALAPGVLTPGIGFQLEVVDFDGDGRSDLLEIAHHQSGGIRYGSHLNRTPRAVPGAPVIGPAGAGNAHAAIFFSTPLGSGTSPITGYTARCGSGQVGSGTTSPIIVAGLTNGHHYACTVTATNLAGVSVPSGSVAVTPAPQAVALDRTSFVFSAVTTGAAFSATTSAQTVRLLQNGAGPVTWTASSSVPWLLVSPASGTGSATLSVSVRFAPDLNASQSGRITLTYVGGIGVMVARLTTEAAAAESGPVGSFDTPAAGLTGVAGSIAVTGWAMDDVEVTRVRLYRNPVGGEPAGQLVFLGNAVFVDGARPDVTLLFPSAPRNTRAGWGYLLLTNFLPNGGNGTFTLSAFADDVGGRSTLLGTRTFTADNAGATRPFGAIDTPGQGETVSGTVNNFGWVLSRGTRRADPPSGGTVVVVIDGVVVGTPFGWVARPDLTNLFPRAQYAGVEQALGVFGLDTTTLSNGVHTIAWVVTDNLGAADGVGSRYFTVSNGAALTGASAEREPLRLAGAQPFLEEDLVGAALDLRVLHLRRGPRLESAPEMLTPDDAGLVTIDGEELDRIELLLGGTEPTGDDAPYTGYLRVGSGLLPLPVGSRLDPATGVFTWQPGVAFVGSYDFVFVQPGSTATRREVRIVLHPKGSGSASQRAVIDTPGAHEDVSGQFVIAGWAIDPDSPAGTGVATVHVWAYPRATCDDAPCEPIFLGAATYGGSRPDVAELYGARYRDSGFGLTVSALEPGSYDIAVFAWSTATKRFLPAAVALVTVR